MFFSHQVCCGSKKQENKISIIVMADISCSLTWETCDCNSLISLNFPVSFTNHLKVADISLMCTVFKRLGQLLIIFVKIYIVPLHSLHFTKEQINGNNPQSQNCRPYGHMTLYLNSLEVWRAFARSRCQWTSRWVTERLLSPCLITFKYISSFSLFMTTDN